MKDDKSKNLLVKIVEEYKKVTWPTKSEIFQVTIVVLLITIFVAILVMAFDLSFKFILDRIANIITSFLK